MNPEKLVINAWIDGREVEESGGGELPVYNKYSGKEIALVRTASSETIEHAINTTVRASELFATTSAGFRSNLLKSIRLALESNRNTLEKIIVAEAGKPIDLAEAELQRCLLTLEAGERECLQFKGEMIPVDAGKGEGKTAYTSWFSAGPVLGFSPFNYPLNLALHKIVPAIAAGSVLLIKPSPHTPLSLLFLAKLISESGVPPGIVNVVCCGNEQALTMVKDPRFKVFSFTGSAAVGWKLKQEAGNKKTILELGGNAPVIVDETADLKSAAQKCARSAMAYAGQVCIATQRIVCTHEIYEPFLVFLQKELTQIQSGNPEEPGILNGPMIDEGAVIRLERRIQEAVESGAQIIVGGKRIKPESRIFEPTLMSNTPQDTEIYREEAFGPVIIIEKARDFDDAINRANTGIYGLQCGVFTQNINRMKQAFKLLQFGGVIINNSPDFRLDHMPYGGIKQSGFGREGIRYAMEEMSEQRLLIF